MFKLNIHAAVIACSALLVCLAPRAPASADSPSVLFQAPWGDKPGEIGILNIPEMEKSGPISFCADGQNVFILDSVHKQVLKIDGQGKASVAATNIVGWSIAPDGNGGLLLLDDERITHLDAQGALKNRFAIETKGAASPTRVQGYGIEMFVDSDGGVCLRTLKQNVQRVSAARIAAPASPSALSSPETVHYRIKRMAGNEVRILGLAPDGKEVVSVPVRLDGPAQPGAALFKGTDAHGNLYVELETLKRNTIALEVHRYAPSGARLAVFSLPNDYFTTVYKKTEVTRDGSVYQMLTTPQGVRIIRYGSPSIGTSRGIGISAPLQSASPQKEESQ
jgi:hypothetical protein